MLSSLFTKVGSISFDVSPNNMMFKESTQTPFLVDFGIAAGKDEALKGFYGTRLYAHSFIFLQYPRKEWKSKPKNDYTSLALSMATLSNNGKCPWKPTALFAPDYDTDCIAGF